MTMIKKAEGKLFSMFKDKSSPDGLNFKILQEIHVEISSENALDNNNPVFMMNYKFKNGSNFTIAFHSDSILIMEMENEEIKKTYQISDSGTLVEITKNIDPKQ